MSEIKKSLQEAIEELDEGKLKDLLTAGLAGGSILMGNPSTADAKTDFNKLHLDHEIINKYEHGGEGNSSVNKDNYGGYSYGKNQISTERRNGKPSTFDFFLKFMKDHDPTYAILFDLAGGWDAAYKGSDEFVKFWKKHAHKPEFNKLYDNFILSTQIIPAYKTMDASKNKDLDKITTWASENDAVQAAVQSCIVQHGPAGARDVFRRTMELYHPKTAGQFLHELYKYRAKRFPNVKNRYADEGKDLKNYYKNLTMLDPITGKDVLLSKDVKVVRPPSIKELVKRMKIKNSSLKNRK